MGFEEEYQKKKMVAMVVETNIDFATDMWTSRARHSYMAMDMQWTKRDWSMQITILGTVRFQEEHSAANIAQKLIEMGMMFGVWPWKSDIRPI